jgi:signal transduction histidine kinase/DNA-binding response OmpR family regulator
MAMPLTALADGSEADAKERTSILVVDDLPEQRLVIETILADLGQNLVFGHSGTDALREIMKREFAVILLDVNMPDIDGFETAELIRKYKRSAHTPIIFMTAYADEMQTARGYSLGAVDYILAPVIPEVLRSKVKVFVELHNMQRQLRRQVNERIALAAAEAARSAAEQNTRRSNFLSQASRSLSASLDIEVGKRKLLELAVPAVADGATLILIKDDGSLDRALSCSITGVDAAILFEELEFEELPTAIQNEFSAVLAAANSAAIKPVCGAALSTNDAQPDRGARTVTVPLTLGERSLGAMCVRTGADLDFATLEELANRAAIAFENARLYRSLQNEIAERQQAETMLQDINQRKDEFLAMLSHELRNPLAPIRNAVEVIRMMALPEPKLAWANDVTERQVNHMTRLIEELLDVARINQGKIVLKTEAIDLREVAAHSVETVRPFIDSRQHKLTQEIPDSPIWLRGDFARLSQVISNLMNNAAKYTDNGGAIHLALTAEGGQAVIAVRDNGVGIAPDLLPKVFELFKQGEQSLDRGQGGLGIGLTLAQRLAQLHNGRIDASSDGIGKGSEFRLTLPCLTEVTRVADRVDLALSELACGVKCRVLVVDDNADAVQTIAMFLELAGHEVKAVTDGRQALACANVYAPDVVVLDIGLPIIDGYQVAQQLRAIEQMRSSLVIALTGYGREGDRERALKAGFDSHLVKPADPNELLRIIEEWRSVPPAAMMTGAISGKAH